MPSDRSQAIPRARHTGPIVVIAWGAHSSRPTELAQALGAEARSYGNFGLGGRPSAPMRWLLNGVRTIGYLARRRPSTLIVQNPPIFLAALAHLYKAASHADIVLDSHPASFGRKDARTWGFLLPLHRHLARRSAAVLVTDPELSAEVSKWGGTPLLVHEAPPAPKCRPAPDERRRVLDGADGALRVLLVAVFARDEPVAEVLEAARGLDDVAIYITGDTRRADPVLIAGAPAHVQFVGYLGAEDYDSAVGEADVVLALTTERTSVMRAAYEAVYAERPLIVSDWPIARELFTHAILTGNSAPEIAGAIEQSRAQLTELRAIAGEARVSQIERWSHQLSAVRGALGLTDA